MYLNVFEACSKIKAIINQFKNPPHDVCSLEKEFLEKVQGVLDRSVPSQKADPEQERRLKTKKGHTIKV